MGDTPAGFKPEVPVVIDMSWRDPSVRPLLLEILRSVNASRRGGAPAGEEPEPAAALARRLFPGASLPEHPDEAAVNALFGDPGRRLAVYGSLAPGEANDHVLDGLGGEWREGTIRGRLVTVGWGQALGFPGLTFVPDGPPVPAHVLTSTGLPGLWSHIDAFEGDDYVRVLAPVEVGRITLVANVYELRDPAGSPGP